MFCMKPQFFGIKAAASHIGHAVGNYTAEMFQQDFPQFLQLMENLYCRKPC